MVTGTHMDRTYRSGEKFNEANLEEQQMEFLYTDGNEFCFMNSSTFVQEFLTREQVGDNVDLLKENTVCNVLMFNGTPIDITLPNFIELQVSQTDPWVKGDTATGSTKPATLETGYEVQVPPFIEEGDLLRIDTRTKAYVERVKK
jgi:elongation factor P